MRWRLQGKVWYSVPPQHVRQQEGVQRGDVRRHGLARVCGAADVHYGAAAADCGAGLLLACGRRTTA